jgi:AAA family ATP:ADP antiporter
MSSHDPFPMSSKQAQNLAASVRVGGDSEDWHAMNTTTAVKTPKTNAETFSDDKQGLVSSKNAHDFDQDSDEEEDQDDDFLDTPLSAFRGSPWQRNKERIKKQLLKVYTRLYGEQLPPAEMLRTLCLASTLFFMIGGYWLLRSLKDPVLTALCGISVIPKAKMLSVFVVLGVVTIYNHLLDTNIPRHHLFYIFGTFYSFLFTLIALLLMHPTLGLPNQQASPYRLLGWISYCSIESFGSVMVSLFWSFANSNFSLETAKASYGVMVATAQVGSILGPTFVNQYGQHPAKCYLVGAFCMLLLQGTMYMYISIYGIYANGSPPTSSDAAAAPKKKQAAGVLEGLSLFWKYDYVKGIFAISCLFMVEVTIVDYTMKMLAKEYFTGLHPCTEEMTCWNHEDTSNHGMSLDATAGFTTFMGLFGQATNTLSFLLSLLGTSAVIRYLGLRLTLLLFPTLCLAVIIFVRVHPTLYVVFGAMMLLKANSYALNNPTKEMLYQPTSSAVKYKAKSWIDIFGARGSKALGSVVTNAFSDSASNLVANGSLVGMAVASFLIWNARFMGNKFDEYVSTGHVVGGDDDEELKESDGVQMAMVQNDNVDTSCAIDNDDDDDEEEEEESDSEEATETTGDGTARITQV